MDFIDIPQQKFADFGFLHRIIDFSFKHFRHLDEKAIEVHESNVLHDNIGLFLILELWSLEFERAIDLDTGNIGCIGFKFGVLQDLVHFKMRYVIDDALSVG